MGRARTYVPASRQICILRTYGSNHAAHCRLHVSVPRIDTHLNSDDGHGDLHGGIAHPTVQLNSIQFNSIQLHGHVCRGG